MQMFSFSVLNIWSDILLACKVSSENSTESLMGALYRMWRVAVFIGLSKISLDLTFDNFVIMHLAEVMFALSLYRELWESITHLFTFLFHIWKSIFSSFFPIKMLSLFFPFLYFISLFASFSPHLEFHNANIGHFYCVPKFI